MTDARRSFFPHSLTTLVLCWGVCVGGLSFHPRELSAEELGGPFPKTYSTQGRRLKKSFAPIVKEAQWGTVRIFTEKENVALGTIVSSDGWIVTKASQIKDAKYCEFADGKRVPFEYVGVDIKLDLALLKVEAKDLRTIQWAEQEPELGSWMISVDTRDLPLGVGIMSVFRRPIPRSEVHGVLGIQLEKTDKAIIERVFRNSSAESGGLKEGDEVLRINEISIRGRVHLVETIRTFRPGDTLLVEVKREEDDLKFSVTLTHPFGSFLSRIAFQEQMGGPLSFRRDEFEAVYQHDTVLKPEQCGGPVVNLDGDAVGINIARANRAATYVLPADLISKRLDELKTGKFPPPQAEVEVGTAEPETSSSSSEAPQ